MDLVLLIAVGVVIGVVVLSGVLFLAFRKREEAFTSISQQAEAIEATGKKKRVPKPTYKPWANRPKKGNTPQGSPKVDKSEKAPEQVTSEPASLPKEEPARKKAPPSASAPSEQDKKKTHGRGDDQKEQGAVETKQSPAKREQAQEKKDADKPAPPSQDPQPVPKEPKKQRQHVEETDVSGQSSKSKAKPKTSGKRGMLDLGSVAHSVVSAYIYEGRRSEL